MFDEIGDGADILNINGREISVRQYCGMFNFKGSDQQVAGDGRPFAPLPSVFFNDNKVLQIITNIFSIVTTLVLCIDPFWVCVQKDVGVLSGGERNRLQLAKVGLVFYFRRLRLQDAQAEGIAVHQALPPVRRAALVGMQADWAGGVMQVLKQNGNLLMLGDHHAPLHACLVACPT